MKKTHMMLEYAPVSLCEKRLKDFPGMKQTFDLRAVTCKACLQKIATILRKWSEFGAYSE